MKKTLKHIRYAGCAIKTIESSGRAQYLLRLSNNETVKATPEGYRKLKEVLHL